LHHGLLLLQHHFWGENHHFLVESVKFAGDLSEQMDVPNIGVWCLVEVYRLGIYSKFLVGSVCVASV
jgi:hypothetical protein